MTKCDLRNAATPQQSSRDAMTPSRRLMPLFVMTAFALPGTALGAWHLSHPTAEKMSTGRHTLHLYPGQQNIGSQFQGGRPGARRPCAFAFVASLNRPDEWPQGAIVSVTASPPSSVDVRCFDLPGSVRIELTFTGPVAPELDWIGITPVTTVREATLLRYPGAPIESADTRIVDGTLWVAFPEHPRAVVTIVVPR